MVLKDGVGQVCLVTWVNTSPQIKSLPNCQNCNFLSSVEMLILDTSYTLHHDMYCSKGAYELEIKLQSDKSRLKKQCRCLSFMRTFTQVEHFSTFKITQNYSSGLCPFIFLHETIRRHLFLERWWSETKSLCLQYLWTWGTSECLKVKHVFYKNETPLKYLTFFVCAFYAFHTVRWYHRS